ncbi:hypothetical protein Ancab_021380 [Ancistrocladus abbreviatus]
MDEKDRRGSSGSGSGGVVQPLRQPQYHQYGTFQGVAYCSQPPPDPVVGFPQPAPPPAVGIGVVPSAPYQYSRGYQVVPGCFISYVPYLWKKGYVVAEGTPVRLPRLPCCGIGIGWFLFVSGFFLAAIPWYIGALILLCVRVDYREKPGLLACMIASVLAVIAITLGVTKGTHSW